MITKLTGGDRGKLGTRPGATPFAMSGRTSRTWVQLPLKKPADLRLLAEAAWLADAPAAGIGGVGILSDDADFREFRVEIERAFGVRVY